MKNHILLKPFLLASLLVFTFMLNAQPFNSISTGIIDAGRSAVAWADYDNDGDLDVLVTGLGSGDVKVGKVYRNDAGAFTDIHAAIEAFKDASVCWGDYDSDGDLDLVIAGNTDAGDQSAIYNNDGGVFTDANAGLIAVSNGAARWSDYDNDGDLDLFVTGNWMAKIYRNDDGTFTDTQQDFGFWSSSSMAWGDFDNDGDLDILLIGDSGAGAKTKIFENKNGIYSEYEQELPGLMAGTTDWIDYDNDGDVDIAYTGYNDALEAQFMMFRNDGEGVFTQLFAGIEGIALGSVDWGDYDADGDLDILMSGKGTGCGAIVSGIYRNDGDFFLKIADGFTAAIRSSVRWADYDNDGDLDFIVTGTDYDGFPFTKMYRNEVGSNLFVANTIPVEPMDIYANVNGSTVTFSWEKSNDDQTPQDALSYNFRLGITPGGNEIMASMSNPSTGFRKMQCLGNMNQDTSWSVRKLEPGTYYWSVQAVDQAYAGSGFAQEESFAITATAIGDLSPGVLSLEVYPNPASSYIVVNLQGVNNYTVRIFDSFGKHVTSIQAFGATRIDLTTLHDGLYFLSADNGSRKVMHKFLKK